MDVVDGSNFHTPTRLIGPFLVKCVHKVGNPGFAIVDEAYPYISKRLLTDDSPRLREALRYMIYGKSNVFDVERLIDLLQVCVMIQYVIIQYHNPVCRNPVCHDPVCVVIQCVCVCVFECGCAYLSHLSGVCTRSLLVYVN